MIEGFALSGEDAFYDPSDWQLQMNRALALARSDLAVVAKAARAWQRGDLEHVAALNTWFATTRETSEFRQQAAQMGRSLAQWLRHRDPPVRNEPGLPQSA